MLNVFVQALTSTARLPVKATPEAAGYDLFVDSARIEAEGISIHTGIAIALPPEHVMLIAPRSGLSTKYGLILRNTIGVIDSDYRGEIIIKLTAGYAGRELEVAEAIQPGNRIAQGIILPVPETCMSFASSLPDSVRGARGFGSTGV